MIRYLRIIHQFVKLHYDSQSATQLDNYQVYYDRKKYINIRFHFIKDMVKSKKIVVE